MNWQKAILMWLSEKVEVLEYSSEVIRSARENFQMPSVLRLNRYIHQKYVNRVRFCRENIYLRDNFTCQYCGDQFPTRRLTLDHVLPLSKKGGHNWENVVTACGPCNNKKADKTPHQAGMPLLSHPRRPNFLPLPQFTGEKDFPIEWKAYLPASEKEPSD